MLFTAENTLSLEHEENGIGNMFKIADNGKMFRALIRSIPDHESWQIQSVPIRRFL